MLLKRRGFLKSLFGGILSVPVVLRTSLISYDAVKQRVISPKYNNDYLIGYKGDQFLNTEFVYAPYIPLIQTCHLT